MQFPGQKALASWEVKLWWWKLWIPPTSPTPTLRLSRGTSVVSWCPDQHSESTPASAILETIWTIDPIQFGSPRCPGWWVLKMSPPCRPSSIEGRGEKGNRWQRAKERAICERGIAFHRIATPFPLLPSPQQLSLVQQAANHITDNKQRVSLVTRFVIGWKLLWNPNALWCENCQSVFLTFEFELFVCGEHSSFEVLWNRWNFLELSNPMFLCRIKIFLQLGKFFFICNWKWRTRAHEIEWHWCFIVSQIYPFLSGN